MLGIEAQIKTDAGKIDSLFEVETVPEKSGSILFLNHDHGVLADFMVLHITFALHPSAGPVKDVGFRNLEEAMLHQFFLYDVLNILDVDKCLACAHGTPAHFI